MKPLHSSFLVVAIALLLALSKPAAAEAIEVAAFFSPHGGCAAAIVREVNASTSSILVQAYSISEPSITAALLDAHTRGVSVSLIVDRGQTNDHISTAPALFAAGVPIVCDRGEKLNHNKTMVIDSSIVICGSFNFSTSAELKNAESLLVIRDEQLAAAFAANWEYHFRHSSAYNVTHTRTPDRFTRPPVPLSIPPHRPKKEP